MPKEFFVCFPYIDLLDQHNKYLHQSESRKIKQIVLKSQCLILFKVQIHLKKMIWRRYSNLWMMKFILRFWEGTVIYIYLLWFSASGKLQHILLTFLSLYLNIIFVWPFGHNFTSEVILITSQLSFPFLVFSDFSFLLSSCLRRLLYFILVRHF